MITLQYSLALLTGKLISSLTKFSQSGGTAAPGLYALKIDKKFLTTARQQLSFSIVISGTNGKTTTARILASVLKEAGLGYIHNRTGSNLERGIVSEIIKNSNLFTGLPKHQIGLWEVDEAVLPLAINQLKPKIVVVTNLFRDQLDRYGEIDTLAKKWRQAVLTLPKETLLILNSDDPMVASLGKNLKCKVFYFGLRDMHLGSEQLSHASDATACPNCLLPLSYKICFISHLGIYHCRKCGSIQPTPNLVGQQAHFNEDSLELTVKNGHNLLNLSINLSGNYNLYNVLAALSVAQYLNINQAAIMAGFQHFEPAFGRLETIKLKDKVFKLLLVKNPTGFNQVLHTFKHLAGKQPFVCLLALNDLIADGRDVSWIWDVDVENLTAMSNLKKVIVSGTRAEDMALRVKYANLKLITSPSTSLRTSSLQLEKDLTKAINKLLSSNLKHLFILPTYTAMLEIRKILNKKGLVHSTWED